MTEFETAMYWIGIVVSSLMLMAICIAAWFSFRAWGEYKQDKKKLELGIYGDGSVKPIEKDGNNAGGKLSGVSGEKDRGSTEGNQDVREDDSGT